MEEEDIYEFEDNPYYDHLILNNKKSFYYENEEDDFDDEKDQYPNQSIEIREDVSEESGFN